jgi:histidine triad (HIT) family protein
MPSLFSKIANKEIPSYMVAEDENYFAFLDIHPLKIGHTLVIPKHETDVVFDLSDKDYSGLFLFAKQVARAIKKSTNCKRISLQIIGLEIPHAHIHLIPINSMNDCNFNNEKLRLTEEEFKKISADISKNFSLI